MVVPTSFALIETDDTITVRLPPRQRVRIVVPLTCLTAACFYGIAWCGYQWLTATGTARQAFANISMWILLAVEARLLRFLLLELAAAQLVFDRTTIEVKRSVLGVRIARHWYSCYRVSQFVVTHHASQPGLIRLDLLLPKGGRVLVAANVPTEVFVQLTHTIRRKGFAYLRQEDDSTFDP